MNPIAFQHKWLANTTKERSSSQSHFNDLCALVNHPTPNDLDPKGEFFAFERGASKLRGGEGWADVWYRGKFAVEYKGRGKDLKAAYDQLAQYREDLENPPLLIVSDLNRIEIHTNFTGTIKQVHAIDLASIVEPASIDILRKAFYEPDALKPQVTVEQVTEEAASQVAQIAAALRARGADPLQAAHYLMQVLFCLFAEDIGILRDRVFSQLLEFGARYPGEFPGQAETLLNAMATGGFFNLQSIPHVNGGLFSTVRVFPLEPGELRALADAAKLDWSSIEPAIFGTLFERSLDPGRRAQLGAHYTGRTDIERVVDPVVMTPLRREWEEVRAEIDTLRAQVESAPTSQRRRNALDRLAATQGRFLDRLASVKVLDPACGSGNFLYVALERLLALEKEVIMHGAEAGLSIRLPQVGPHQLLGMEIDPLARELAQVAIWIGYLQWMIRNGFGWKEPVLETLETIRLQDALLTVIPAEDRHTEPTPHRGDPPWSPADASGGDSGRVAGEGDRADMESAPTHERPRVVETEWPAAEFIIGNPPFLGGNKVRQDLGDAYVEDLFRTFQGQVPAFADLCCYFFEKARAQIEQDQTQRAGLLATNSIRGGANREVLKRIKQSGDIYMAWSDEPWILDGAAVRISIIGFDTGRDQTIELNGKTVQAINSDLTALTDITSAVVLPENSGICFMGASPKAPFDIPANTAMEMLNAPLNVNGRHNRDVVKLVVSAVDIVRRSRGMHTIDFALMPVDQAAQYEMPFEHVRTHVLPVRMESRRDDYRGAWWQYARPRPELRAALDPRSRQLATPAVSKHRIFVWEALSSLCNQGTLVFARDDDYFFGVLHSRMHEVWSLRMGTWLGKGNDPRYTPTTCFETFPLP